jgi:hypothetical protein
MFRVFSGDDRETILVCNRREPKENRLQPEKGGARIKSAAWKDARGARRVRGMMVGEKT